MTEQLKPIVLWLGDCAITHGERDIDDLRHPLACLCGAPDYMKCPSYLADLGTIGNLSIVPLAEIENGTE